MEKGAASGSGGSRSTIELRDGFDYQTVLDLHHNQRIELTFSGYRASALKSLLYYAVLVLSLGFMALVFHWNRHWALFVRRKRCGLREAQYMLIVERYKHTEGSQHDAALQSEALMQQRAEEEEHEVYFVEAVHRVGVEDVKDQYLAERRDGVERVAKKEPNSSTEVVKEKWFERFLKRACLFEKPELELASDKSEANNMSKSPDTVTTLVMDTDTDDTKLVTPTAKRTEEIRIHEHFLKFLHFSVHFDEGVFEGE